jgi:hypothetical protein
MRKNNVCVESNKLLSKRKTNEPKVRTRKAERKRKIKEWTLGDEDPDAFDPTPKRRCENCRMGM